MLHTGLPHLHTRPEPVRDAADNTLWLLDTTVWTVRHVKLNGDEISSFQDAVLWPGYVALAMDPADGTLWAVQGNTYGSRWRQYDREGNLLDSGDFNSSAYTGSAEFDILGACYADFTGDGALDLFDFLGYVNAFNAEDPGADCTADGSLDLFDFLCFVNAFNTGC